MLLRTAKLIHRLRVYFLALLVVAFFYYLGSNPIQVGRYIGARFGSAVGMSTSVPENPFNNLALQLKEKENRLTLKENELNDREKALNSGGNLPLLLMGAGIIVLFVLVLVNYYLDFRRKKMNGGK